VFTNLNDEKLSELATAVHNEQTRRIIANVGRYPVPVLISAGNDADNTFAYRNQCKLKGLDITLWEARVIVTHYRNKDHA
jgi:hypothetical protein